MKFENRFYTTKEMYKEYVNKVLCREIYLYGVILLVFFILSFLFNIQINQNLATLSGVIFIILLSSLLIAPRLTLKQLVELDNKLHNGQRPECIVKFDDKIILNEGEQIVTIEYNQIIKYYRLKTCSVLMFSRQNGIIFVQDKFSIGKAEDFDNFILEKCNKVRKIIEL